MADKTERERVKPLKLNCKVILMCLCLFVLTAWVSRLYWTIDVVMTTGAMRRAKFQSNHHQ